MQQLQLQLQLQLLQLLKQLDSQLSPRSWRSLYETMIPAYQLNQVKHYRAAPYTLQCPNTTVPSALDRASKT